MLELYQFENCPYSAKVRRVLTELKLDWISRTAPPGSPHSHELIRRTGKPQVPFLYDPERGVEMFEADDIITYLYEAYGKRTYVPL